MSLSCIIVEDLQVAANYLKNCCEKSGQVEVRGHFSNVTDALSFLNSNYGRPDFPRCGNARRQWL